MWNKRHSLCKYNVFAENKCQTHEVNFGFCVDKVYEEFDAKKANKPAWMMDLNKQDRKIVDMLLKIARK